MSAPVVSQGPADAPARASHDEGLKHSALRRRALPWLVGGWLVASVLGLGLMGARANVAGLAATPPVRLPERFTRAPGMWTLLVFLHPRCPCSRATLSELAKLLDRHGARLSTHVFVWAPHEAPPGFERSELWTRAVALPGVEVVADVDGQVARELGARTSGQLVLFSPDGVERFAGGITPSRGHEGDSEGGGAIRDLLDSEASSPATAPVFGCALETPLTPAGDDT
ncbi:thioredoxin domain-containing protein [Corallococcus exiguus]|uniref:RedB protein n=1 Tax=Corallococcus exiguus TaxID=83462 RepID=A0A7X4YF74_9BACT|nr:RedB protein [Corallococcus exiguus]NBC44315.1 RedB protein [Corallococcus exiguus]TNV66783.1 RedB protein [Corallococcus exiguus]